MIGAVEKRGALIVPVQPLVVQTDSRAFPLLGPVGAHLRFHSEQAARVDDLAFPVDRRRDQARIVDAAYGSVGPDVHRLAGA